VHAVGTRFSVRHLDRAPIQVMVTEGLVEVKESFAAMPIRMGPNTRAVLPLAPTKGASRPVILPPEAVNRELAWREGQIAFEAEPLASAAAAFARYSPTRIVIEDPVVAHKEITGLFTANDPVGFARAAAVSLKLKA